MVYLLCMWIQHDLSPMDRDHLRHRCLNGGCTVHHNAICQATRVKSNYEVRISRSRRGQEDQVRNSMKQYEIPESQSFFGYDML